MNRFIDVVESWIIKLIQVTLAFVLSLTFVFCAAVILASVCKIFAWGWSIGWSNQWIP
jgi:hypothetical protein